MSTSREVFEGYIRSISGFKSDFQVDCNGAYKSNLMNVMLLTWQEQQKVIDEKIQMIVEQARTASNQQKRIDELQARLDAVEKLPEFWKDFIIGFPHISSDSKVQLMQCTNELEQALKGGEV